MKSETTEELFARLSEEQRRKPSRWRDRLTVAGVVTLLVAVVGPLGYLGWWALSGSAMPSAPISGKSDELSAALGTTVQRLCQTEVLAQLKAPSTARFGDELAPAWNGVIWSVGGTVDAQNAFGAALRSNWSCEVSGDHISTARAHVRLF